MMKVMVVVYERCCLPCQSRRRESVVDSTGGIWRVTSNNDTPGLDGGKSFAKMISYD
jgi:hypothetical protein